MKILIFGGHGLLGTEIRKLHPVKIPSVYAPTRKEVDICDAASVYRCILNYQPDIVINAAAVIDNRQVEKDPRSAIETNIIGAANVAQACYDERVRYVYISTDYVYKGDRGNYSETDEVLPFNKYAWTKLGGECSAKMVENHLIIRTTFGPEWFPYPQAFTDKWTSKDYVDVIAEQIVNAAKSPLTGVLNLGSERKSIYGHAKERSPEVEGVKIGQTAHASPKDTSLNLQRWYDYQEEKSIAKTRETCRVCGSRNLHKYLDLGLMPLANNLEFTSLRAREKDRFPLQVQFCHECKLSQLTTVIDPEKMFSYYTYRSAINGGYVKHCRQMAKDLHSRYHLSSDSFVVDIAGNDGTLLKEFKDEIGLKVLNVDPASNLTAIAEAQGIESLADFWSKDIAIKIANDYEKADLITATNVFAHVDDVKEFAEGVSYLLDEEGVAVFEFPYLVDFIDHREFDTVYFEHLSYFGITPIKHLWENVVSGMKLIDVQKQDIHGGTVRVTVARVESDHEVNPRVQEFLDKEDSEGYNDIDKYISWAKDVDNVIEKFSNGVLALKRQGKKIAAFAASAKGNTLLNAAKMNTDIIDYIADETPEKIGKFSPGTGIPIVNKQELLDNPPDVIIILSWNFKEEIMSKICNMHEDSYSGPFIIPIPDFEIVSY